MEGSGSNRAGLTRFPTGRGIAVVEVNRPDRSVRYRNGRRDLTDAEAPAQGVLGRMADATPNSGEGEA